MGGHRLRTILALGAALLASAALAGCDDGGGSAPLPDQALDAAAPKDAAPPEDAEVGVCIADLDCAADQYCAHPGGALEGICVAGCRTRPDSCTAADPTRFCEPEGRTCEIIPCGDDRDCDAGEYCAEGTCTEGCRLRPDNCEAEGGVTHVCVPETRRCVPLYACCVAAEGDGPEACELTRANACDGQLFVGLAACDPSPCTTRCATDEECADAEWCEPERGRCQPGCRLGDRLECPTHEACDPDLRRCVQAACGADADCPPWQFCQGDRCFDGCREGECADGQVCDPESRLCVTLCDPATHAPCGMGARCEPETRRCVPGCPDDAADVASDADDDPATAPALAPRLEGERRVAAVEGRVACPGDVDAYAFEVEAGERLQVTLTQGLAGGALRWLLRGPDGQVLITDQGLAATRQIRWPAEPGEAPAGRYVASVEAVGQVEVPDYALRFEAIDARTGCFGDPWDPGDDAVAGATPSGRAVAGRSTDTFTGDLCRGDVDWFCVELGPEDGLSAVVVAPEGCALDADIRDRLLADRAGPYRLAAGEATPAGTAWRFDGPPASGVFTAGAWCLRVAAADAQGVCEGYLLDLTVDRRLDACTDSQEPNDGVAAAVALDGDGPLADVTGRLPAGEDVAVPLADLQICEGDRDVFAFDADGGDALRAWLVAEPDAVRGELQVRFLDAQGAPRGDPGGVNAPGMEAADRALAVAAGDGRYHVEVSGVQASTGAYTLVVRRDPGDGRCSEDLYETAAVRADSPELAADLTPREGPERLGVSNAAICHPDDQVTDVDWYRFSVGQDATRLCLEAAFRHADGNLDVGLYWGGDERALPCATDADCDAGSHCVLALCREPLRAGASRTDNELVPLSPDEVRAGPYLVRVAGDARAQNGYDLILTQVPPAAGCAADWRERGRSNDQAQVATELGSARVQMCDAWLCHGERNTGDWYAIDVPAGQDRTVHVAFDPRQDGRVLLSAYGEHPPAVEAQAFELQTSVQCINVQGDPEQDRRVLVNLTADAVQDDGDARVDYTFQVVPTDLGRFPRGACDVLSGGIYVNVPWPRLDLAPAP